MGFSRETVWKQLNSNRFHDFDVFEMKLRKNILKYFKMETVWKRV
jgi:hypothetical protein